VKRDIEGPYYVQGCDPNFERFHAGEGGKVPTDSVQTYGSGPFTTLWVKPRQNPLDSNVYFDIPEGEFDEESYFQQSKVQEFLWERIYFDIGMIGYDQSPDRDLDSADQVPQYSANFWNNPCRYMHNFNYAWQYPIYDNIIAKWSEAEQGGTFDVSLLRGKLLVDWADMTYIGHEMFHGLQGNIGDVMWARGSRWLAESTASFAAQFVFPGGVTYTSPLGIAPGMPLGFDDSTDTVRFGHFLTESLSVNEYVQGGHMYASWLFWWFLAEHVRLPNLLKSLRQLSDT
jgi:hypothetical protein